jgi:hypothetical protein
MTSVYFSDCGGLYFIGKVKKDYNIGDELTLKNFKSKVIVTDKKKDELHVKTTDWQDKMKREFGIK